MKKDTDKQINQLGIEETLTLITSALAGGNPGAEYWYRRRITGKLFRHLINLAKANDATIKQSQLQRLPKTIKLASRGMDSSI